MLFQYFIIFYMILYDFLYNFNIFFIEMLSESLVISNDAEVRHTDNIPVSTNSYSISIIFTKLSTYVYVVRFC